LCQLKPNRYTRAIDARHWLVAMESKAYVQQTNHKTKQT
jgi:hypothetical protein